MQKMSTHTHTEQTLLTVLKNILKDTFLKTLICAKTAFLKIGPSKLQ